MHLCNISYYTLLFLFTSQVSSLKWAKKLIRTLLSTLLKVTFCNDFRLSNDVLQCSESENLPIPIFHYVISQQNRSEQTLVDIYTTFV